MLRTELNLAPNMAGYNAKPYAIMEFDSLLATAFSYQYIEDRGINNDDWNTAPLGQQDRNTVPLGQQDRNTVLQGQQDWNTVPLGQQDWNTAPLGPQDRNTVPLGPQDRNTVALGSPFERSTRNFSKSGPFHGPLHDRQTKHPRIDNLKPSGYFVQDIADDSVLGYARWSGSPHSQFYDGHHRNNSITLMHALHQPEWSPWTDHLDVLPGETRPDVLVSTSPYTTNDSGTTSSTLKSGGPVVIGDGSCWKPGPNLIKPIAFKPVQAGSARSPVNQLNRRTSSGDDHIHGPQETPRPHTMKLGISMLGVRGSPDSQNSKSNPGAFNSMAKSHQHNLSGQQLVMNTHSYAEHSQHSSSHPSSVNSSHNSSQHNSSSGSHHNMSSSSYINIVSHSQHNLSGNSSHVSSTGDNSFTNEFPRASDRPDSVPSMNTSRVSSHTVEGVLQTPSPSDSGVGELEAILREKDAEINTLREVMDRNERAIFQVYEERRHVWLQDTQELRDDYERKLKVLSRKSYKTEQVLSLQVYKLQQEQKTLQEEKAKVTIERDHLKQQVEENQSEITQLRSRHDSLCAGNGAGGPIKSSDQESQALMEELALKNKELITVKSQLQSFEADMDRKNKEVSEKVREIAGKTEQLKSLKEELLRIKHPPAVTDASSQTHVPSEVAVSENMKPSMLGERDRTINGLQDELLDIKAQLAALKDEHEKEREQWLDEKNKVVRYQKQLQLNYVQMQRKNATLETEVQQLTLELENRDMKLIDLDEESMC